MDILGWLTFKIFFKSLLNLLQCCFWFFGFKVCGILVPWPGIELAPFAMEGEFLTTGPPRKSGSLFLKVCIGVQLIYSVVLVSGV